MRRLLTALAVLAATAALEAQSNEGTAILTAPAAACQGASRTAVGRWINPWGPTYLTGGYVWAGTGRGLRADVGFQLYIMRPHGLSEPIAFNGFDRYGDPNCATCAIFPLPITPPHYVEVPMGAWLELHSQCQMIGEQESAGNPTGVIPPYDYFYNLMAQQHIANLRYVWQRPGATLDAMLEKLTELVDLLKQRR